MSDHADHGAQEHVSVSSSASLDKERLLYMYGFVKKKYQNEWNEQFNKLSDPQRRAAVRKLDTKKIKDMVHEERTEVADETFSETGFPGGAAKWHLVLETGQENIESHYFEILERTRQHWGFPYIHKVSDYFAASENSAFFGNSQQRLGIQQDRVQQFLANIGKFVKELFQMVRELRIIDERLVIYESASPDGGAHNVHIHGHDDGHGGAHSGKGDAKHSHAADISLKSIFTDVVEGGTKNPQSVFGLASQVNFTLLPDLFFNTYVGNKDDVDKIVDQMEYNKSIKAVLKRKLYQYVIWKEKTYAELKSRRAFNLKYLRQHWSIIKLYMAWVKPYLKNIQRLSMQQGFLDKADIIAAFETSFIEVEFIAYRDETAGHHPTIVATFFFRTRPDMTVRKEYQTGPSHAGRMDVSLRAYAWTPEQLENYKRMKAREEIELLGLLDSSLSDIMDALGEEFEKYLIEAGEEIVKEAPAPAKKKKAEGALAPFLSIFGGFKEMFEAIVPLDALKSHGHDHKHHHSDPKGAFEDASERAGKIYHSYKKQQKMITW